MSAYCDYEDAARFYDVARRPVDLDDLVGRLGAVAGERVVGVRDALGDVPEVAHNAHEVSDDAEVAKEREDEKLTVDVDHDLPRYCRSNA